MNVDHEFECAVAAYGGLIEQADRKGKRQEAKRLRRELKEIVEKQSIRFRAKCFERERGK